MAADNALSFPVVAVNEALTKHLFDNRYGTGQSTIDGILQATNILIAGRNVVIAGYGWVGRGSRPEWTATARTSRWSRSIGPRARGADGRYQVMTVAEAAPGATGVRDRDRQRQRVPARALRSMRDGAIMANSGHFDAELDLRGAAPGPRPHGAPRECPVVRHRRQEDQPHRRGAGS
jgi:adenosylhomocysteinase